MTRAEYDALVDAAVMAIIGAVDPDSDDAIAAREEAQLLEAEARAFADAIDRDRKRLPYGDAVVLHGENGVAVTTAREYAASPLYWRTVVGHPEHITEGPALMQVLAGAANRGSTRTP